MMRKSLFTAALFLACLMGRGLPAQPAGAAAAANPKGPCDIYAQAGDPCVAAHSTTRALYAAYHGPLYQLLRQSDGKLNAVKLEPVAPMPRPKPKDAAH